MMNFQDNLKKNRVHLSTTHSTSSLLKKKMQENDLPEFTVITTDFQTAGHGQRGNHWEAERNQNLLFSFLLHPFFLPVRKQFLLSEIVALSLKKVLDKYTTNIQIKWPNDIYWKEKKIAGILIEHEIEGNQIKSTLVGIGLNVNQIDFKSDAPNPISLAQILEKECNKENLLQDFFKEIRRQYEELKEGKEENINNTYHEALFQRNKWEKYKDKEGEFTGKIQGVDAFGCLKIEHREGDTRTYGFKDVNYILS